jgi:MarR family transcriptional regulator, lower aerobic nicotinate degradation pathway regulator
MNCATTIKARALQRRSFRSTATADCCKLLSSFQIVGRCHDSTQQHLSQATLVDGMSISPTLLAATTQEGPSRELLLSTPFLLKRLGMHVKEEALEAFEPTGLNPQHHAVLSLLDEGVRETQATIADALGYDRSHLVGILDELEEKGCVERRRDPADRRRHLVSLTPAGTEALHELRAIAKSVEKAFLTPLTSDERQTLHALLLQLARHHDPRCAGTRLRS